MAFENLFKKIKKFSGYTDHIERKMELFVEKKHKSELVKLLSNFETEIPMHVVRVEEGDNISFVVEPIPNLFVERNNGMPEPGSIETAALFYILNDGTRTRYARMPEGFNNESSPNSLSTSHQDYPREEILVSRKFHYSIEPRNWLELTEQKHRQAFAKEFENKTKSFFKSLFGK